MAALQRSGKTVVEFPEIMSNPTYAKVMEGAECARDNNVGLILGVGGGSVMDCCKAISLAAVYKGDAWADFWARPGVIDFEPLPLIVVVTAAGTGSEMNGGAVITNEELRTQTGRDYPQLNPKFALLDPTYTYSVPVRQMVSGGFDTLSHIMETYFSAPDEPSVSDDIMEALMRGVIRYLRAAIKDPKDYTARSNLMWESAMAENRITKLGKKCDFPGMSIINFGGIENEENTRTCIMPDYDNHPRRLRWKRKQLIKFVSSRAHQYPGAYHHPRTYRGPNSYGRAYH